MFRKHGKRFWAAIALVAAVCAFYFPSLIAYRYTAGSQNQDFLTRPWRSWEFLYTAFTVPGDSRLKTSGAAFRRAEAIVDRRQIDVLQVRLLFLEANDPFVLMQSVDGRRIIARISPPHRFVWQVEADVRTIPGDERVIVMLLDYRSGRMLWDARPQLPDVQLAPAGDQE